jgi:hypothetical protein
MNKKSKICFALFTFIVIIITITITNIIMEKKYFENIQNIINQSNKIIGEYCEKNFYDKKYGIIQINKWDRFIELNYLIYDKKIYEVNISFDGNTFSFEGYDQYSLNELPQKYIEDKYPFLK